MGGEREVMQTLRSYLSKFSGLIVVLLAVLLIGGLAIVTMQSAENNQNPNPEEASLNIDKEELADSSNDLSIVLPDDEEADAPSASSDNQRSANQAETEEVLSVASTSLPNTGPTDLFARLFGVAMLAFSLQYFHASVAEKKLAQTKK